MQEVRIQPFEIESYPEVRTLWEGSEGVGLHDDCDSREGIESYLQRNPGLSFVAMGDGGIVGAVLAGHDGRRGYIYHLGVHADWRRRGIGRRLIERCLGALRDAGIKKCHTFVFTDNPGGIAFWKSLGWTPRTDLGLLSRTIE